MSSNNEKDDLTLAALFEEVSEKQPKSPYEDFFLPSNPFPAVGQFIPGICVDQDEIKQEFARTLREFYVDERARRMTIVGSTGAGKTNLLRFFQQQLEKWREPQPGRRPITDLFTLFIHQPQGSYFEIHRQFISQLGALFYTKFFEAVQSGKVDLATLPAELPGLSPELVRVLAQVASRRQLQLSYFGPNLQSVRILDDWLQGVKLSATDKKYLGSISVEVGKSSTMAVKFLGDLLKIFRHAGLFKGIVVFFDEFEEVLSGLSRVNQAQYAQDLRNLFDTVTEGVVFVIGTAPISDSLNQISPALNRRLGEGISIEPIRDEETALTYAQAYIQLGRTNFKKHMQREVVLPENCPEEDRPYYPLMYATVVEVYRGLQEKQVDIVPGDLLPELNLRLYRRVYEGS
jgi:Cdc6-like AAA superfamily ATPase